MDYKISLVQLNKGIYRAALDLLYRCRRPFLAAEYLVLLYGDYMAVGEDKAARNSSHYHLNIKVLKNLAYSLGLDTGAGEYIDFIFVADQLGKLILEIGKVAEEGAARLVGIGYSISIMPAVVKKRQHYTPLHSLGLLCEICQQNVWQRRLCKGIMGTLPVTGLIFIHYCLGTLLQKLIVHQKQGGELSNIICKVPALLKGQREYVFLLCNLVLSHKLLKIRLLQKPHIPYYLNML